MRSFEYYVEKGDVKKQSPNKNLSAATYAECLDRLALAKSIFVKEKPKYVLENAYEAMREAADAILYLEGYKSYSHEASIVYLMKKGFTERDIFQLDRLRKIRNDIKYYGKDCDKEDARDALALADKFLPQIKKLLKE